MVARDSRINDPVKRILEGERLRECFRMRIT